MNFFTKARFCTMFATCLALTGCHSDSPGSVETAIVHGKVTLDDQPLSAARVTFIPLAPIDASVTELKPMSFGETDDQGSYSLIYADGTVGAVTGQHTILISKPIEPAGDQTTDAVPEFYRQHGYLKRHVLPLSGSQQINFELTTVDPLLRD